MERLIAQSDLYNPAEYGRVEPGDEFECRERTAELLLKRGKARRLFYDTKVIYPQAPEVSAREPFRNVPALNPLPAAVAPESDRVLPGADVPESRTADRSKRR